MPVFTVETARQAGLKSVEARKQRALERDQVPLVLPENPVEHASDPFCDALASACGETLHNLRTSKKPMEKAQLARALRDLRETWHMATGKPKPGMLKPGSAVERRPAMPRVYPSVYPQNPSDANNSNTGT